VANDLGQIVAAEVGRAEADYQAVRSRALNIVGLAGGLVTLVTGLLAIAVGSTKVERVVLSGDARWTLGLALLGFVASTVCALVINLPGRVTAFDVPNLRMKVQDEWDASGQDQEGAAVLVDYLDSLRVNNGLNARLLMAAILCQILGIVGMATTAILIANHTT
jgi:hypothetical protein